MKKMKIKKGNSGITLVALIITIIVLIILAGVTISMVVGDNGIITKSKDAKKNMTNASSEEKEALQNMVNEMNEIESGIGGGPVNPPGSKDPTDPENWDKEKVPEVVTEGDRHAPIPKGYVVSKVDGEKSISGGLVIYEGTEDVTNENVDEAQKTRNQYVWIPVDEINDMVMCKSKTADSQCNIVKEEDAGSPNGFKLKCSTHNSEDLAGKLYDTTKTAGGSDAPYTYTIDFSQTNQSYSPNDGRREPAIVTGNSSGDGDKYDGSSSNYHELGSAQNLLKQMNGDFVEMVKSVYTYGGFYLGRYEVGAEGATKREQTVLNNSSSSGNMWYGLYKTIRHKAMADEVVNKDMIWRKPI